MAQEYYDLEKTADVLKLSAGEVNRLRERSELHAYRDGSNWKFRREDVEKFLTAQIKKRSQPQDADDDFGLSLADDELVLGESSDSSFSNVKSFDGGLTLEDDAIALVEDTFSTSIPTPNFGAISADDDELVLGGDDILSLSEGSNLDLSAPQNRRQAAGSVDLAGTLDDDDVVLGTSSGNDDLSLAGDSSISLTSDVSRGVSLSKPAKAAQNDGLELDDDDDILALSESAFVSPASVTLAKKPMKADNDEFELEPLELNIADGSDSSESSSQVIAIDEDDPLFTSDDDVFSVSTAPVSTTKPKMAPVSTAKTPDADDPFAAEISTPAAGGGDFIAEPAADTKRKIDSPYEPVYGGLAISGMLACTLFLSIGLIMSFDLVRSIWSWNEPFSLNGIILGLFGGK